MQFWCWRCGKPCRAGCRECYRIGYRRGAGWNCRGNLHWRQGGLALAGARFTAQDCLLANVGPTRLAYHQGRWQLSSDKVSVDSACLSKLPGGDANSAPLALDQLQRELPSLDLTLSDLTLIPLAALCRQAAAFLRP